MRRDPLHETSPPGAHWTTSNIGEALPGVPTPLSWTVFGPAIEGAMRGAFTATGAFGRDEWPVPYPLGGPDRITGIFFGRPVLRVDSMAVLGDRMPGTSGEQVVEGFYGTVPADMEFSPTRRRYGAVAVKLTRNHFTIAGRLEQTVRETPPWYHDQIERIAAIDDPGAAAAMLAAARVRFDDIVLQQATAAICAVQPAYDAVTKLAASAGVGDVPGLTSGYGNVPETAAVRDVWRASRGEIGFEELVRRHGHHGPHEGELSATVWREDGAPLRRLVEEYAGRGDDENPLSLEQERAAERERLEREVLDGTPLPARPIARAVLARAKRAIPLRGMAKGQFLRAFDVCRAAARRAGELHASVGRLQDSDDVFYLTAAELAGGVPDGAGELVAMRRARRAEHEAVRLPTLWTGDPEPVAGDGGEAEARREIAGIGVSSGVVEGLARVVTDPTFAEVEAGEILVSATTDPGWASIMFISSALVVDIGGHLSHAAVVARELGIPCVVETGDGSRAIKTGDRLQVDGGEGVVTVLERAGGA